MAFYQSKNSGLGVNLWENEDPEVGHNPRSIPRTINPNYDANMRELQRLQKILNERPQLGEYKGIGTDLKYMVDPFVFSSSDINFESQNSPWYKMALENQALGEKTALQRADLDSQGALANARAQLSMRGGLRSGAAERLAQSGMQNTMNSQQNLRMAGLSDRANLGMKSADLASNLLQNRANTINNARAANVQTKLWDLAAQQDWRMKKYTEEMKDYAARMSSGG